MKENQANQIKDVMWTFLMDKGQKENIPALKEAVYDLIYLTTRKSGAYQKGKNYQVDWNDLDMVMMEIVIEATALVLSGRLDELEEKKGECEDD